MPEVRTTIERMRRLLWLVIFLVFAEIAFVFFSSGASVEGFSLSLQKGASRKTLLESPHHWRPAPSEILNDWVEEVMCYGRELIELAAQYPGAKGKVLHISNGMNCKNSHPEPGTKPFAANDSTVASALAKFREEARTLEEIRKKSE